MHVDSLPSTAGSKSKMKLPMLHKNPTGLAYTNFESPHAQGPGNLVITGERCHRAKNMAKLFL